MCHQLAWNMIGDYEKLDMPNKENGTQSPIEPQCANLILKLYKKGL